jgi:hypothetical protein
MKIHSDKDCPAALGEPVAVIGYGSQGRAHALNLRDSDAFLSMRQRDSEYQIETVGRELRSTMTWLEPVEK